jgi:hypothetical protein
MTEAGRRFGLLAEFDDAGALVAAARRVREEGYRRVDAYTPMPVEGLADALSVPPSPLPAIVLGGGLLGGLGAFGMQVYASAVDYPLNVGGRPLNSWPSFVVITFEVTVLAAALAAVLGMLALNRLPRPYHPVFNVPRFALASRNRFFLLIEAKDPRFDPDATRGLLRELGAKEISDVAP